MRYIGQEYSILVPLRKEFADDTLLELFHESYLLRYGHSQTEAPVEFVSLRMAGIVNFGKKVFDSSPTKVANSKSIDESRVFFGRESFNVPIYSRNDLSNSVEGNAIILEESTTIIVPKKWTITPTNGGHLIMDCK